MKNNLGSYLLGLSEIFEVPKSKIEILKGENNPHKKVSIEIVEEAGRKINQ